jgi:CRISPR-associated protein Csd2
LTPVPTIQNRYDFVYLFDVTDGNPNGDPDAGNQPRVDPETGEGLITDVCLKRKVRNFVTLAKRGSNGPAAGFDIYVKDRGILAHEQQRAYQAVQAEPGDRPNEAARRWMCQTFYDVRTFGAVMTTGKVEAAETSVTKPSRSRNRPKAEEGADAPADADQATAKPDNRRKQWNCGQVRGPVQLTFARSVHRVLTLEHAITRVALTNAGDTGRESSGEGDEKAASGQMGRKATLPYGLYQAHGFVSPQLATDTGFTDADLTLLWQSLIRMFEHDHSATKGRMTACKLFVFKHATALGNAASHRLFKLIDIKFKHPHPDDGKLPAVPVRSVDDFVIRVDRAKLPAGVELIEYDCETFADEPVVIPAVGGGL